MAQEGRERDRKEKRNRGTEEQRHRGKAEDQRRKDRKNSKIGREADNGIIATWRRRRSPISPCARCAIFGFDIAYPGAGMSKVRFRTCLRNTIYDALRFPLSVLHTRCAMTGTNG